MGSLFSTLEIARSGMQAAQIQMDISGHNVANVNKEGFSRQRISLTSRSPVSFTFGQLGRGVQVDNVVRMRDTFLDGAYRRQAPGLGFTEIQSQYFSRIEDLFLEPGENGFNQQISRFFDTLNDFANNVEQTPVRQSLLSEAESLTNSLNSIGERLYGLRTEANAEIKDFIPQINSLAERIAYMNVQIRDSELGGRVANDLRDDRDLLLDELSSIVRISYREQTDGQIDVLVGGDQLVFGQQSRALEARINTTLDPDRNDLVEVVFADNGSSVNIDGGEVGGLLNMRDTVLLEVGQRMDTMAAALIENLNRIHTQGNGLHNLSGTLTSDNRVSDPAAVLTAAGLPFSVSAGSFDLTVYDGAGNPTTTTINVGAATTLNDVAAALNAAGDFSASVTADNNLQLGADAGFTFTFGNDTSGLLTALGVNGLFTGTTARDIGVNQMLLDNPTMLSSGYSLDILNTGDNAAALAMANLRDTAVLDTNTASIGDYYESNIVKIGIDSRSNSDALEVERSFVANFDRRRQEVSGVSIDEEVTYILQYQRAFEASARVVTVVDSMIQTILNMAG